MPAKDSRCPTPLWILGQQLQPWGCALHLHLHLRRNTTPIEGIALHRRQRNDT